MVVSTVQARGVGLSRTHASVRWLGTKQAGVCAVGYMSSPKGETFREECEPTLPQGSPKGDMSGSEGGNARRQRWKKSLDRIFFKYTLIA